MINRLAYCIDSPHYYHQYNFLSTLYWLASNNYNTSIITLGNLPLQGLTQQLPDPLRQIIRTIPLAPLDTLETIKGEEIYTTINPHFPNFPNETLSIGTTLIPDRCVGYVHTQSTESISSLLIDEANFSELMILGSATDAPINNYPIIKRALDKNLKIIGFPFGNVTGRYSPFWLKYCDKIYLNSPLAYEALTSRGYQEDRLELYEPIKFDIQNNNLGKGRYVIDLGIHSPRHELTTLLKTILEFAEPSQIFIQTNQAPSFIDCLHKYLNANQLPQVSIGNSLDEILSAKKLFSLFPFACYYLLENFSLNIPISIIDFHSRYSSIDGLKFTPEQLSLKPEQIVEASRC